MGAESRGQVGGMEGSESVRREFAKESRTWGCRECGGGKSNEEVMREWWGVCREKGVEVDVEGCEVVGGVREESKKTEERGEKEDGQSEAAGDETSSAPAASASLSAVAPVSPVPSGSSQAPEVAVVPSTPSAQSNTRPGPTPTTPAPVSAPATMATRTAAVTPSEPANSPWLDRAIIGIIFALIILTMKRVLNIDDL